MFVGIPDNLSDAGECSQFFGSALRIATGDDDAGQGILPVNPANGRACILIGGGRDRASIQNNDFRIKRSRSALQSAFLELPLDGGTIGLGRAATKILYVKTRHRTIVAAQAGPKATGRIAHPTWVRRRLLRQFGQNFLASHLNFGDF